MIKRKLFELFRLIYQILFLPFIKIFYELKTNSIIKQRTFIYGELILGGKNFIGMSNYLSNVIIGFGSYMAENCHLVNVKIGKYCSIGSDVKVIVGRHPISDFVAMAPCFYSHNVPNELYFLKDNQQCLFEECKYADTEKKYYVEIGNDVWIGSNVSILDGVTIGDGAVIGANSLVTKDVLPYSIVGGSPAKVINYRFTTEQIDQLLEVKWWNKDTKWIHDNIESFGNIDMFLMRK